MRYFGGLRAFKTSTIFPEDTCVPRVVCMLRKDIGRCYPLNSGWSWGALQTGIKDKARVVSCLPECWKCTSNIFREPSAKTGKYFVSSHKRIFVFNQLITKLMEQWLQWLHMTKNSDFIKLALKGIKQQQQKEQQNSNNKFWERIFFPKWPYYNIQNVMSSIKNYEAHKEIKQDCYLFLNFI